MMVLDTNNHGVNICYISLPVHVYREYLYIQSIIADILSVYINTENISAVSPESMYKLRIVTMSMSR